MSRKLARPTDEGDQDASFEVKGEYEKDEEDFGECSDSSCIVVMSGRSGIVESPGNLSIKQTRPT